MTKTQSSTQSGFLLQGGRGRPPKGVAPLKFSKKNRKNNRNNSISFWKSNGLLSSPPPLNFYLAESQPMTVFWFRLYQGALAWETKRLYIRALQCAIRGCLEIATAVRPNTIFFFLHCGTKPLNYGLVLACFSLSCNPGATGLRLWTGLKNRPEKQAWKTGLMQRNLHSGIWKTNACKSYWGPQHQFEWNAILLERRGYNTVI